MVYKLNYLRDWTDSDFIKQFICGFLAGFVSVSICHPLDVMRTRMNMMGGSALSPQNTKHMQKYSSISNTLKTILAEEGLRGFYRGYKITVISIPFFNSIYFPIYNYAKKTVKQQLGLGTTMQALLGSVVAGIVSNTFTNPIWIMRTRYMVEVFHPPSERMTDLSLISAYKKMIEREGFRSLFKGWVSSMMGICHAIVYFPVYENIKMYYSGGDQKKLQSWQVLLASITSKLIASFATYPHVVIRTIMQDNRNSDHNLKAVVKNIYRQFGIKGFYMGIRPDLLRILPSNAIIFVVYEFLKKKLS